MLKIRKKFKNMNEVVSFLRKVEADKDIKNELGGIIKNIEETLGNPDAEISNYKWIGSDYKKEFYFSEIFQGVNSYDESFNVSVRVKNNNIRLIVLIDYINYSYNYEGSESDEYAILKIAYTN